MVTYESRPTLPFMSKSDGKANSRKPLIRIGMAAATMSALILIPASPAFAGAKKVFVHCPVSDKKVTLCMTATTVGGEFAIGSTTLALSTPVVINMGLYPIKTDPGFLQAVAPTDGTPLLDAQPIPVSIEGIPGLLTATPQLLSLPVVNIGNFLTGEGPSLPLPLDVLLSGDASAGLGSDCTIGDAANPIAVDMTTGTTDPPPPNTPISGSTGVGKYHPKSTEISQTGVTVVDNSFEVPDAYNCGPLGILDPILDSYEGLPSASGNNTAIMNISDGFINAAVVRG
jgi:hypothetical protein